MKALLVEDILVLPTYLVLIVEVIEEDVLTLLLVGGRIGPPG